MHIIKNKIHKIPDEVCYACKHNYNFECRAYQISVTWEEKEQRRHAKVLCELTKEDKNALSR